jgi:carbon-monoxide dehydrogenase small subunit
MTFNLNDEEIILDVSPEERLSFLLRDKIRLESARCVCLEGRCGICAVIFNGRLAAACQIPGFRLSGAKIVTIEGFRNSANYRDIVDGFKSASVSNCEFCASAKILAAESLLAGNKKLSKKTILDIYGAIKCSCNNPDTIVEGVLAASEIRRQRLAAENISQAIPFSGYYGFGTRRRTR